jgi:hypothetical protein
MLGSAQGVSQPKQQKQSPLLGEGQFQKAHKQLEKIFQFTLDGSRLKLDRQS